LITPIIETDRILLRPMKVSDAESVSNNWAKDPDVTKYLRWNVHQSINTTIDWLRYEVNNIENEKSYQWIFVHKDSNDIFGAGGLSYDEKREMFELGYAIMQKYWNQGLTTEIVKAIVKFAVDELTVTKIFATPAKEHFASQRVLEKAGFFHINDSKYSSFDGKRIFDCKDYIYTANIH